MFKKIFQTATWRQSQITILSTLLNGGLGALFYILLARFLGPANFGLFSIFIAFLTLIADIADFGINTGLVRFVSLNWQNSKEKALRFLKLGLISKIIIWLFVFSTGFFLSPFIAQTIFQKADLTNGLRLTFLGVGSAMLFTFATSSLQATQKYLMWSLVNITTNLFRLIVLAGLIFYQQLNLQSAFITYIALPLFGFFMAMLILPVRQFIKTTGGFNLAGEFFKFNLWVAAFTVVSAISSRLDTFLNARLLSTSEVGIYSAASQLTSVLPQLVGALGVVAAPKFSQFPDIKQMLAYFKKLQLFVLGLSFLISLIIPEAFYFIPLIYGMNYQATVLPFIILLVAMIIFLISLPLHSSIIYYFARPQVFVWISLCHLLINSVLGYYLILSYGVIGAAVTVLVGMLFNFAAPLVWFLIKLKK